MEGQLESDSHGLISYDLRVQVGQPLASCVRGQVNKRCAYFEWAGTSRYTRAPFARLPTSFISFS